MTTLCGATSSSRTRTDTVRIRRENPTAKTISGVAAIICPTLRAVELAIATAASHPSLRSESAAPPRYTHPHLSDAMIASHPRLLNCFSPSLPVEV
eukprot:g80527.t1